MPTYSIEGPDGKTYSIDGPEGATREQIIGKIKERMGQSGTGPDKPAQISTAGDAIQSFGRGIAKGAIGLAGLPGDIAHGLGAAADWVGERFGLDPLPSDDIGTSADITRHVESQFGKFEEPQTTAGKYAQSIGEFVPSTVLGPGRLGVKALQTIGGGLGSEFMNQQLEDYGPGAQAVGRVIGGAAGGFAGGLPAVRTAGKASNAAVAAMADKDAVHAAGSAGYDFINKNNIPVAHALGQDLVDDIRTELKTRAFSDLTAPTSTKLVDRLEGLLFTKQAVSVPTKGGGTRTVMRRVPANAQLSDLLDTYQELGNLEPGTKDAEAARLVRDQIMGWIDTKAGGKIPKVLKDAMGNWSAYKKMDELETAKSRADIRTESYGTGQNFQNYLRDEIKKIIDPKFPARAKGYKPEEIEAMKEFVAGSALRNATRIIGKGLSPASPLGFIRFAVESLASTPLAIGSAIFGAGAHKIGDFFSRRDLENIIHMVQSRAPVNAVTGPQAVAAGRNLRAAQDVARAGAIRGGAVPTFGPSSDDEGSIGDAPSPVARITVHPRAPYDALNNPSGVPIE